MTQKDRKNEAQKILSGLNPDNQNYAISILRIIKHTQNATEQAEKKKYEQQKQLA